MTVRYTRAFKRGDKGSDVEGVGRALSRSRTKGATKYSAFILLPKRVRQTWGSRKARDLILFKKKHGLGADSYYGENAHKALSPFFDARARKLMQEWSPPPSGADKHWLALVAAMKDVHAHTPGYLYGGGHAERLDSLHPSSWFDCSSSTSYVLHRAGLFSDEYAWVSGKFATSYGSPGRGQLFTVWASPEHVWIQIHRHTNPLLPYWRFDTSPQGDPKSPRSGARLRFTPRFIFSFTPRHFPGL